MNRKCTHGRCVSVGSPGARLEARFSGHSAPRAERELGYHALRAIRRAAPPPGTLRECKQAKLIEQHARRARGWAGGRLVRRRAVHEHVREPDGSLTAAAPPPDATRRGSTSGTSRPARRLAAARASTAAEESQRSPVGAAERRWAVGCAGLPPRIVELLRALGVRPRGGRARACSGMVKARPNRPGRLRRPVHRELPSTRRQNGGGWLEEGGW